MEAHARLGAKMLENEGFPPLFASIARLHHEKGDGTGYDGLILPTIPLSAAFVGLLDEFDVAVGPARSYKNGANNDPVENLRGQIGTTYSHELLPVYDSMYPHLKNKRFITYVVEATNALVTVAQDVKPSPLYNIVNSVEEISKQALEAEKS
jgi:response regulator RpfG family c-di-GMP phosphodiesterase